MGPLRFILSGGLSLLWMSSYFQLASTQCTASSETGFDYQVQPESSFAIHWAVNEGGEEISFKVVYDGAAYVSVGFSSSGRMTGSDAVIGLPDDVTVLEYDMTGKYLEAVVPATEQELSNASVTQTDTGTTMTFIRPLAPDGENKRVLSAVEGEEAIFIWAYGSSNDLDEHSRMGDITLTDILCSDTVVEEEEDDDEEVDDDEEMEDDEEVEDDDSEEELVVAENGCESSDSAYDFEISPASALSLFWRVNESTGTFSVKAVYDGEGWLSIGFSDDRFMPGSDAIVGLPDTNNTQEYDMPRYGTPEPAEVQEATAAVTQVNGVTTLTFTRPLAPAGDGKQVLTLSEPTYWLYAWGSPPFQRHSSEGAFSMTLGSCDFKVAGASDEENLHGWLMALSWAFFFPMGILFARFSPDFKKVGFRAHWMLQSVGAILAFIGFFTALAFTEDVGKDHFEGSHAKVGLFLTIFLAFQVAGAFCRPAAPTSPGSDAQGFSLPPKATTMRLVWSTSHRIFGSVAVVLGILNCYGGLDELEADDKWDTALTAVVVIMVVLFVLLQLVACIRGNRRPEVSGQPIQVELGQRIA